MKACIVLVLTVLVLFGLVSNVSAFNIAPFPQNPLYNQMGNNPGNLVYVDCQLGNDSNATGFQDAPFRTIAAAHATDGSSYVVSFVIIQNGPCDEPTVTPSIDYSYFGSGDTAPVITNGFSVIATTYLGFEIYWEYLHLKSLTFDTNLASGVSQVKLINVEVDSGSIISLSTERLPTFVATGCNLTLSLIQGNFEFVKSDIRIDSVAASSSVSLDFTTWSGSTIIEDNSLVVGWRSYLGDLTMTSPATGHTIPNVLLGLSMYSIPTVDENINLVRIGDTYEQSFLKGTATVTTGDSITITLETPLLHDTYFVTLTPLNVYCTQAISSGTVMYLNGASRSRYGFTVEASNTCQFDWKIDLS